MNGAARRYGRSMSLGARTMAVQLPRVLLVENDAGLRRELSLALGRCGYEVLDAADGRAALERLGTDLLDRRPPELIIADARSPDCGGMAVLDAVREMEWRTRVIEIVAFGDPMSSAEAFRRGAAAVFLADEPFDVDDFCAFARGVAPHD